MLSENIKALRKAKNMSQEELANRLHVVRQTISKWEKGLSVPDAELLTKLAEELETDVGTLLGAPVAENPQEENEIAHALAGIAEQLAVKNRRSRRIWRTVAGILIAFVAVNILLMLLNFAAFSAYTVQTDTSETHETIEIIPEEEHRRHSQE